MNVNPANLLIPCGHVNIHELDAASNNKVDDIRSLTDQVRIPPQIGKYSIYIIDDGTHAFSISF